MLAEGSYGTQLFAALFFVLAGARLLLLSQRTGEAPERLLGLYFALTGIAYLGWALPYMVALGALREPTESGSWIAYGIGVVPYLLFTRAVFRSDDGWATALVITCVGILGLGTAVLGARGDLYPGLDDPYYWLRLVGYTTPCAWMTIEAFLAYRIAFRRRKIGLSDAIVVNRYILMALFGGFQTLACLSDIFVTLDTTVDQAVSAWSDSILGGFEIVGIAMLWLAFFPPALYLSWLGNRKPAASAASERA